ncbi:MAG: rod shape-determining protein MreD [Anaerolineae bacterium]
MGSFVSIPLLALAAVIQSTFVPQLRLSGGGPDLVFMMVLSWAVNAPLGESLIWALVGGICLDLLSAAPLGTSALGMVIVVFFISGINQQVYRIGFLLLSAIILLGTTFQQVTTMIVLAFTGHTIVLPFDLSYVVAPTIVYNFILIWPVYFVMRRIQKRLSGEKPFFAPSGR